MRIHGMISAQLGWNAIIYGEKNRIACWALAEVNIHQGSHTYTETHTMALISNGQRLVVAQEQEGFKSIQYDGD